MESLIYKILRSGDWQTLLKSGHFGGSAHDERDGFIHFSTWTQLPGTLKKHYEGEIDLILLGVPAGACDPELLRWESSRGGALFPHLYGPISLDMAQDAWRISMETGDGNDVPILPDTTLPGLLPATKSGNRGSVKENI